MGRSQTTLETEDLDRQEAGSRSLVQKAEVNHASECSLHQVPQDIPSQDSSHGPHTRLPQPSAPSVPFPKGRKFYHHVTMPTLPSPRSELRAVRWAGVSGFSGVQSHQSQASRVGAESSVTSRPGLLGAEGQHGQPCRARRGPLAPPELSSQRRAKAADGGVRGPPPPVSLWLLVTMGRVQHTSSRASGMTVPPGRRGGGALGIAVPKQAIGHRMS